MFIVSLLRSYHVNILRNMYAYTSLALNVQDRGMAVISNSAINAACRTNQFNRFYTAHQRLQCGRAPETGILYL